MRLKLKRNTKTSYLIGFLSLLIIEILIANYINDDFIRPYLGDFLVVILIYCFLMFVSNVTVIKGLLIVLIFSFTIEFIQLIDIVSVLGYQPPKLVMIILGSSFSLWDLLAYTLGVLFAGSLEFLISANKKLKARSMNSDFWQ